MNFILITMPRRPMEAVLTAEDSVQATSVFSLIRWTERKEWET
jgi:hypothetical protein